MISSFHTVFCTFFILTKIDKRIQIAMQVLEKKYILLAKYALLKNPDIQ